MEEYQRRVVGEKEELDLKINDLDEFCFTVKFGGLSEDEQARLNNQLAVMEGYSDILRQRIDAFDL